MKIAYLIPAHNNPRHLKKLVSALDYSGCDFYIHIDKKSKSLTEEIKQANVDYLKNRVAVHWGGFSQVEATLRLMKEASKKSYDYYVLISGVDYPVRSNKYIHSYFERNKGTEFINISPMPENNKSFDRLEYMNFDGNENIVVDRALTILKNILKKINLKRMYPEKYSNVTHYGGSTWWALTENCVSYILEFVKQNPEFVDFYKNTYNADEMFFQTIIGNSPFNNKIKNALTYADWKTKNPGLPARLTKVHLPILEKKEIEWSYGNKTMTPLFARKFEDSSDDLIEIIESSIRSKW